MFARFGSFDAESWWRPADLAGLPSVPDGHAASLVTAMDTLLAILCAPGDLLITHEPVPPALAEALHEGGLTFDHRVAAGTGPVESRIGDLAGYAASPYAVLPITPAHPGLPDPATVARVNSKVWSNELVRELALPGAAEVARSTGELREICAGRDVVLKDPYGVAGRGTLRVEPGGRSLDTILRTLDRQHARIELLAQPYFQKQADISAHMHIKGDVEWIGAVTSDNPGFAYRGSSPLTEPPDGYEEIMMRVAKAVAAEGYTGPLCVDSLILRDGTLIPVLEINARVSMGLLSLRLGARLRQRPAMVGADTGIERLVEALDRARLLGPVLPLTNTLRPPRGRLIYALYDDSADRHLIECARAVGLEVRDAA